jgi:hypothetical protein
MALIAEERRRTATSLCEVLNQLKPIVQGRKPTALNSRQEAYFWTVLPYRVVADRLFPAAGSSSAAGAASTPPPHANDQELPLVADAARDLLRMKRLLDPVGEWTEYDLFQKEDGYADDVEHDPRFRNELSALARAHPKSDLTKKCRRLPDHALDDIEVVMNANDERRSGRSPSIKGPGRGSRADARGTFFWADQSEFDYEVSCLCRRFQLNALSRTRVWPALLELTTEEGGLTIRLPMYLRLDWARRFPSDVVVLLQERLASETSTAVRSLTGVARVRDDMNVWLLRVLSVVAVCEATMGARVKTMDVDHATLELLSSARLALTSADDLDDKVRVLKRRLETIVERYGRDSLLRALLDVDLLRELLVRIAPEQVKAGTMRNVTVARLLAGVDQTLIAGRKGSCWDAIRYCQERLVAMRTSPSGASDAVRTPKRRRSAR